MFDSMLESSRARSQDRSLGSLVAAFLAHLGGIGVLIAISLVTVNAVQEKLDPIIFEIDAPSPLPPPPPPPGPSNAYESPTVTTPVVEPEPILEPPEIVPDVLPDPHPPVVAGPDTGPLGGVPGGDPRGIPGGQPGGEPGGPPEGRLGGIPGPAGPIVPTPDVTLPVLVHRVQPEYPEFARRLRLAGRVICQAVIDDDGNVTEVQVLTSDNPIFDEPTRTALRHWKYEPAVLGGAAVSVYLTVVVDFELK